MEWARLWQCDQENALTSLIVFRHSKLEARLRLYVPEPGLVADLEERGRTVRPSERQPLAQEQSFMAEALFRRTSSLVLDPNSHARLKACRLSVRVEA
jgi:hypothetical protein